MVRPYCQKGRARNMLRLIRTLTLFLSIAVACPAFAQESRHGAHRHLTNIVFSGLAGAVLGLSTLSFYGRPQDKLNNIGVGFAIGVIGGTLYSTYRAAAAPRDFYGLRDAPEPWALADDPRFTRVAGVRVVGYDFTF